MIQKLALALMSLISSFLATCITASYHRSSMRLGQATAALWPQARNSFHVAHAHALKASMIALLRSAPSARFKIALSHLPSLTALIQSVSPRSSFHTAKRSPVNPTSVTNTSNFSHQKSPLIRGDFLLSFVFFF